MCSAALACRGTSVPRDDEITESTPRTNHVQDPRPRARCRAGLLALSAPRPAAPRSPPRRPDYATWDQYLGGADSSAVHRARPDHRPTSPSSQVAWEYPAGEGAAPQFNPDRRRWDDLRADRQRADRRARSGDQAPRNGRARPPGASARAGSTTGRAPTAANSRLVFLNDGLVRAIERHHRQSISRTSASTCATALPAGLDCPDAAPLMTNNPGRVFEDTYIVSLPAGAHDYALVTCRTSRPTTSAPAR